MGHPDFIKANSSLKKDDYSRLRVDEAMNSLKQNKNRGEKLAKTHWPEKYKQLDIRNLFRYEITKRDYRLIYTIRGVGNTLTYQLLDFVDHDKYNKIFGYRG